MKLLRSRRQVDQPFLAAVERGGRDRVYVGSNDFGAPGQRTATIDHSQNGGAANPTFSSVRLERRSTGSAGQDGPQVRPICHRDGTVYVAFYGWRSFDDPTQEVTTDIVLVRDDQGGTGTGAFGDLVDPFASNAQEVALEEPRKRFGLRVQYRVAYPVTARMQRNSLIQITAV